MGSTSQTSFGNEVGAGSLKGGFTTGFLVVMSLNILIVEDDIFTRMELEMILAEAGHQVVGSVSHIEDALSIASGAPLSAAIVDLGLSGGGNGIELAKRLRDEYDVPSLLISGRVEASLQNELADLQPLGIVSKPFHKRFITAALDGFPVSKTTAA